MKRPNLNSLLMTVEELAHYLKIKPDTIYKKVKKGEIPAVKLGKLLRFPKELIDQWIIDQATKTLSDVRLAKKAVKRKVGVALDEVKKTAKVAGTVINDVRKAPMEKKQKALNEGLKKILDEVDQGIRKIAPSLATEVRRARTPGRKAAKSKGVKRTNLAKKRGRPVKSEAQPPLVTSSVGPQISH